MPSYNGLPSVTVIVLRTLAIRDAFTLQGEKRDLLRFPPAKDQVPSEAEEGFTR